ncbi:MAG: hypothetical protein KAJ92_01645, partial [Gammaproteobacteria bacterium]|nr:hypothetical protein [Gammaproteobacteria bacterium]
LVAEMIIERMQNSLVPLACTEPPKKKLRNRVDAEQVAEKSTANPIPATPPETVETDAAESQADEHDFGEKVLQASVAENSVDLEKDSEVEEKLQDQNALSSVHESVSTELEGESLDAEAIAVVQPVQSKTSRFLQPMLLGLFILLVATVFFALSLDDEKTEAKISTIEANKHKKEAGSINRSASNLEQEVVQTIPDEIKKQLDEAKKTQQEMVIRQQEDRARMKVLEEQAVLLQRERDKALAKAEAEKKKRAAETEAARISAEREKAAEKIAQEAIAAAQAEAQKAKSLEELRLKEKQASAEAMAAQQKKLDAVVESVDALQPEAEKLNTEADDKDKKVPADARCQGPAARFLSICR